MTTLDDIAEPAPAASRRTKFIGIWVSVLAVLLALAGWAGGNAALDAQRLNVEAGSLWAWYQAKNVRANALDIAARQAELEILRTGGLDDRARQAIERQALAWREHGAKLVSDAALGEGMSELVVLARSAEAGRDAALRQDQAFGAAIVALNVAIVFASLAIVTGTLSPLAGSAFACALGAWFLVMGFVG